MVLPRTPVHKDKKKRCRSEDNPGVTAHIGGSGLLVCYAPLAPPAFGGASGEELALATPPVGGGVVRGVVGHLDPAAPV